ncbi:hypothetical protein SCP_0504300 [Sparassis crispa]|uniref:Uncharacterized protein n=1 Tax=Sparassis crispa TaxID=139825 RepID=A0A401GMG3_9APHY|nr:hypothetical protein SCP_0504300 [Sparassis crispa]GBE83382.1 hypothetical protein SCP_0504300 [Sparassis crispa]
MSNGTTFLVTPPYALQDIPVPQSSCFSMRKRVFPHLDLDHLPESLELGWKDGLSLGVYHINTACVRRESAEDMDRRI